MSPEGSFGALETAVPVVGVGASAGGLEAFQQFLTAAPADGGVAYVLIQHIDPNFKSHLPELLARWTSMPVAHVADGEPLSPDRVYLAPPNMAVRLDGARIRLTEFEMPRGLRRPIDSFFRSLAEARGGNCACIVLSGTGSDGAAGLRAVREAGGLTLVQTPETAKYDGMPQSAVQTGSADHVVGIERMPELFLSYFGHLQRGGPDEAGEDQVRAVCRMLHERIGHDFSGYKRNTLVRRMARRLQVTGAEDHEAYVALLREDMRECELLFRDLLISVTEFFRDREAFEALAEKVIRPLVAAKTVRKTARKTAREPIRVWVAGCSSGEEAYSIAILVHHALREAHLRVPVQVFATDIDDRMLQVARTASYPDDIVHHVPERYLADYFVPAEGRYLLSTVVQDMVVFSPHNMLSDPPFSRIDLVSCRNTLIYMQPSLQERVFTSFAYSLKPDGFLFLGSSEGLSLQKEVYDTVDLKHRLYRRRADAVVGPTPLQRRSGERSFQPVARTGTAAAAGPGGGAARAVERVVEAYAPAHLVADGNGRVVYSSGRLGRYLEFGAGTPSNRLLDVVLPSLRPQLRLAVERARKAGARQVVRDVEARSEFGTQAIDLVVEPLGGGDVLVLFRDLAEFRAATEADLVPGDRRSTDDAAVEMLEDELERVREQLRNTVEELETSNEELKSSNEEMMSMNEELQSTNEELTTVNDELKVKVDELAAANGDLQNLLQATHVATIFLDRELVIRTFNPAAAEIYRLQTRDRGRPLSDFSARIGEDLEPMLRAVLDGLDPIEREVGMKGTMRQFILRITPYRTVDDVVDGLVVTFTEVTLLKGVQARLEDSHGRYAAAARASGHVLYDWEPASGEIVFAGPVEELTGYAAGELTGCAAGEPDRCGLQRLLAIVAEGDRARLLGALQGAVEDREPIRTEFEMVRRDGARVIAETRGAVFEPGAGRAPHVIGFLIDNSHRAELEASRRQLVDELQHRVKNVLATVQSLVRQTGKNKRNKAEFETALLDRLAALARTHELVSVKGWARTGLETIVRREVEPYVEGRAAALAVEGPDVMLPPRQALALTLALHELTTNAAKYGALSVPEGRLGVCWAKAPGPEGKVAIDWTESGGPEVRAPKHRGFGRTLLERGIAHDLNGEVRLDFAATGLKARILFRHAEEG